MGGAPGNRGGGAKESRSITGTPQSDAKPEQARVALELDASSVVDAGLASESLA